MRRVSGLSVNVWEIGRRALRLTRLLRLGNRKMVALFGLIGDAERDEVLCRWKVQEGWSVEMRDVLSRTRSENNDLFAES